MTEISGTTADPWCEESLIKICEHSKTNCINTTKIETTNQSHSTIQFNDFSDIAKKTGIDPYSDFTSCTQLVYSYYIKETLKNHNPLQIKALKFLEKLHLPPNLVEKVENQDSLNTLKESISNLTKIQIQALKTGKTAIDDVYGFYTLLQVQALELGLLPHVAENINTTELLNALKNLTFVQKQALNNDKVHTIEDASQFSYMFQIEALNHISILEALNFTNKYQVEALKLNIPPKLAIKFQHPYQVNILKITSTVNYTVLQTLYALHIREHQVSEFMHKVIEYNNIINPETQLDEFSFEQTNVSNPRKDIIPWQSIHKKFTQIYTASIQTLTQTYNLSCKTINFIAKQTPFVSFIFIVSYTIGEYIISMCKKITIKTQ